MPRSYHQVLVLDLDHTLLNSVRLCDVSPEDQAKLARILEQEAPLGQRRLLYCLRYGGCCTA